MDNNRSEFLAKIYDQMFNDIDRHHKIVWQTMGVLIGAFAVLALIEKNVVSIDIACALIVLLSSWVLSHVYDSNYWYNRNLVIIANIERQFLLQTDLKEIHYYFGKHRNKNAIQTSLKIQNYFCSAVIFIFLLYHFTKSIYPGFKLTLTYENIRLEKLIPYIALIIGLLFVNWLRKKRIKDYSEFIFNSPGIVVDTNGINFGTGHPI
ncbi:hypothetical protein QF042_001043 [Pedobacter sp. W3I1]|uniref:hypothetical protein n=1 Tax=Pedobacter sp. W3I1 TaxID=3042291 RepID=UPI002781EC02|nr:hypothetical protein [Pedobacter sp. W3I1]MDQ0637478.1 hypothetical protein [Pedobacter sp. W3I1]